MDIKSNSNDLPLSPTSTGDSSANDGVVLPTDAPPTTTTEDAGAKSRLWRRKWMVRGAVLLLLAAAAAALIVTLLSSSDNKGSNKGSSAAQQQAQSDNRNGSDNVFAGSGGTGSTTADASPGTTSRPSSSPTLRPTAMPSGRPTPAPTTIPSEPPTVAPSSPPTDKPTGRPTPGPSAAPTRSPIPDGFRFRFKMHWENDYFWQEEADERQWCLECTTCQTLTSSDYGEGCYDYNNNDGTDCRNADQIWMQNCNGWNGSSGNAVFEIVRQNGRDGDQIKVVNKDYCLTQATKRFINLQTCNANDPKQLWVGFRADGVPFDVKPLEQHRDGIERCMSQHHHPKKYEILYQEECELAHTWDTALWDALAV
jgi:hypothetical protein